MNGLAIHRAGNPQGRPLVLIHGWAMHAGIWQGWLPELEEHDLWLVDLPGHGHSHALPLPETPASVAEALLQQLPEKARWLGWSMGGLVALEAALQAPQRVQQLIMLAATPCFVQRPDWPLGKQPALFQAFSRQLREDRQRLLQQFLLLEVQGCPQARSLVRQMQAWLESAPQASMQGLSTGLQWLETIDLRPQLATLEIPSLWLGGTRDRLVHPQALAAAAGLCPDGRVQLCEGAIHAPFISHPQWMAEALNRPS